MKKKKVGILTLNILVNYGGILQCYALMKVLKDLGHDAWYIDKRYPSPPIPLWLKLSKYSKRFIQKYILREKSIAIFLEKKIAEKDRIISQHTQKFINKYIEPKTKAYKDPKELINCNDYNFDACIVGSDQVWRAKYALPLESFYLNFLDKNKTQKIAYAASFGLTLDEDEYSKEQIETCGKLIKEFKSVSVREKSGINIIKEKYKWECPEPQFVLDPTMLLKKEDYIKIIEKSNVKTSEGNLFYYLLDKDEEKNALLKMVEEHLNIRAFTVYPKSTNIFDPLELQVVPSVEKWLQAFIDAEFIVTDSFHGTAFSILFNKPFIVYGNKDRGVARFESILELFDLKDRYITSFSEVSENLISKEINWEKVNNKLKEMRKFSESFLEKSLENNN